VLRRVLRSPKKQLKGFCVLPVALAKSGTLHLYFKKHSGGEEETLFVANVPFGWSSADVQQVFSCFGEVASSVILEPENPSTPGAKRALLSFANTEDFERALKTDMQKTRQPFQAGSLPCGMQKWLAEYQTQRPAADKLQIQVDRFMEFFDQRSNKANTPDEDGWTTVAGNAKRRRVLVPKGVTLPDKKKRKRAPFCTSTSMKSERKRQASWKSCVASSRKTKPFWSRESQSAKDCWHRLSESPDRLRNQTSTGCTG